MTPTTSTRRAFAEEILSLAAENPRIVALAADTESRFMGFRAAFPQRFFNVGIAEQNLIGVAAGFALAGKTPFVAGIATFISMRCFEQVRTDIAYPSLDVKLIGSEAGVSAGDLGATHHSIEDIALYRTMPNMTVIVPADATQTRAAVRAALAHRGPVYIRIATLGEEPLLPNGAGAEFTLGRGAQLREGCDVTLVATGRMVAAALDAAELLAARGIAARVINIHTIKPIDHEILVSAAAETGRIFTIEEHTTIGGLGGAVTESLAERHPVPIVRLGFADHFALPGPAADIYAHYGLTGAGIARTVEETLRRAETIPR